MKRRRRQFSAEEKTRIVLEILEGNETLNQIGSRYGISPRVLQNWKKQFLENASLAFEPATVVKEYKGQLSEKSKEIIVSKKINTWDYQWAYARHKNNGIACVPKVSLIENIGFGEDATHTFDNNQDNVKKHEINFPLKINNFIIPDRKYDELFLEKSSFMSRVKNKLKRLLK